MLIFSEWCECRQLDWNVIADVRRRPTWLFDAPAIADDPAARAAGLNLWRVEAASWTPN